MATIISTHFDLDAFRSVIQEELKRIQETKYQEEKPTESSVTKLMDAHEIAEYLGLKLSTIYSLTHTRKIPFYKPGKKLLFDPKEIQSWVHENRCSTIEEITSGKSKG